MVVLAFILFLTALVFVGGVNLLRRTRVTYTTDFKFAGGLEPGAFVRFAGLKVGTVQSAEIDKEDPTRIRVQLSLRPGTPVRADSQARISTLGFLGENYVEISPGTKNAPLLPPGSRIPSAEIVQLADVFNNVNNITLNANKLVGNLDHRVTELSDNANQLINNFNALVGEKNRAHIQSAIDNIDAMLAENRPHLRSSLANIDTASAKLPAAIDNANQTLSTAKTLATNLNSTVEDNRAAIREALINLRTALVQARELMGDMQNLIDANRGNLDESLENIRVSSKNLKEFTDQIKRQPFSLIRVKTQKDREPPIGK
jgi:phospholipid/cholesterol/gamma-HCH transport system substrate-binding protein